MIYASSSSVFIFFQHRTLVVFSAGQIAGLASCRFPCLLLFFLARVFYFFLRAEKRSFFFAPLCRLFVFSSDLRTLRLFLSLREVNVLVPQLPLSFFGDS